MAHCVYNNPLQDAFCFVYVKQVSFHENLLNIKHREMICD